MLGDQPLLSISKRLEEESAELCNSSVDVNSNAQSLSQWLINSSTPELEASDVSEKHYEETDLEKELLIQQCRELREELAVREKDLNVLTDEVFKSAEELEEARSR